MHHQASLTYNPPLLGFEYLSAQLTKLAVLLLFTISGGVLFAVFGMNYNGIEGVIFTKIHPSTYIIVFSCLIFIITPKKDDGLALDFLYGNKAVVYLLVIDAFFAIYIVAFDRKAIASTVDTYLLTALMVLLISQLSKEEIWKCEGIIHSALMLNALIALFELLTNNRYFPYAIDGVSYEWDTRSSALLGHPLANAAVTGSYVIILLFGGGLRLSGLLKPMQILLQFAALGAFGGRTAFILVLLAAVAFVFLKLMNFLRGERLSLVTIAGFLIFAPIVIAIMAAIFMSGTFDILLDRFTNDGGSANARLVMFELFNYISPREFIWGAELSHIRSLQTTYGIEMGIENPIVMNILVQGLLMTLLLLSAIIVLCRSLVKRAGNISLFPLIFFIIVVMSFESLAGKTILLAQFSVLMLVLYQNRDDENEDMDEKPAWHIG